jgi:tRNA1Val (adenine37-N6)-methyltransferase
VEVQPAFAELIDRNAAINRLSHRVRAVCADLRELRAADFGKEVDLVFSNPPYMKCNAGKRNEADEKYIARHEVCGGISDFCDTASRLLKHGGRFVCVWRPDRLTALLNALHRAKLEPKRMTFVHADASAEPSVVLVESVKGGAPSLYISPPLLLYLPIKDGETVRKLTPAAEEIYQTCNFSGLFSR